MKKIFQLNFLVNNYDAIRHKFVACKKGVSLFALFWFSFTLTFVSANVATADVENIEVPLTAGQSVNPNICEKQVVGGRVVFENVIEHGRFNWANTTYFIKGEHLYRIAIGMQRSEEKVFYRCEKYSLY